ncbi:FAD-dependent oxidoreductase [Spongiactinospora sp. 9N601]|uniref:FAD-dependent oxidoreductase n=1 Tax=Spongiactinospora sp. 9N601 TaxID=3375149 RepID=UPI0037A62F85
MSSKRVQETCEVLVVGGGPAGLCAALFLARNGINVAVAERREHTGALPRAFALTSRTMELFRVAGLEDRVRSAAAGFGHIRQMMAARTLADPEFHWISDARAPSAQPSPYSPADLLMCPQSRYEAVLADAARTAGADLRPGTELVSFTSDADGVTALLRSVRDDIEYEIRARYLVAADGARSTIRETLGIPRTGQGALIEAAVSVLFHADLTDAIAGREFFLCALTGPEVRGVLIPIPDTGQAVLGVGYDPQRQSAADFTPERCTQLLRHVTGQPELPVTVEQITAWTSGMRIAERFSAERIFLLGDAAHQMTPAGGFGANTAMQSAHNLAWKLAAVLGGWADSALLASYEAERRPVAWATAEQAALRTALQHGPLPRSQAGELADEPAITLGYRYPSHASGGADGPAIGRHPCLDGSPGSRAPHVWLQRDGRRISTIDLFDRSFTLLSAGADGPWGEAAQRIAESTAIPLRHHAITPSAGNAELWDIDGRWPQTYGLGPGGAVLVRPDGYIAWRAPESHPDPHDMLRQVLATLTGTTARNEK